MTYRHAAWGLLLAFAVTSTAHAACIDPPMPKVDWVSCDKHGTNLTGARLEGANLTYADLTGARLEGANLSGARLTDAYLSRANLTSANLSGARLDGAELTGARLEGANLSGAYYGFCCFWGSVSTGQLITGILGFPLAWLFLIVAPLSFAYDSQKKIKPNLKIMIRATIGTFSVGSIPYTLISILFGFIIVQFFLSLSSQQTDPVSLPEGLARAGVVHSGDTVVFSKLIPIMGMMGLLILVVLFLSMISAVSVSLYFVLSRAVRIIGKIPQSLSRIQMFDSEIQAFAWYYHFSGIVIISSYTFTILREKFPNFYQYTQQLAVVTVYALIILPFTALFWVAVKKIFGVR
jgi:Pentapeptide repeats (8 copies)